MSIVATLKGRLGSLRLDVMRSGKVPRPEGSPAEVAARLSAFVTQLSPDERLRRYDYLEVLQGADVAFGAQHFNEADAIYSFLVARGQGGYWARLRQADLARLRGDYDTALAQIDALADDPEFDQRGELVRARVYLAQADYVRAAASLRMVVAADPTNVDFLRMLFRALEGSGDTEALAQPEPLVAHLDPDEQFAFIFRARCFCGDTKDAVALLEAHKNVPFRQSDYRELVHGADVAFGAQHFNEADAIYSFLVARGQGGYWARLRQADLARLRGDYDTALAQIDALADDPEFDQRGELVRARVYLAQADYVRAAASLRMVVAADPTNVDFLRMLFRALEGSGDTEALAQPEPLVAHLDPDEQFAFIFRARCFCGEVGAVHELMAARPALVRSAESSVVAQCLRMLGRQEDRAGVLRIGELTQAVRSDSPDVLSALLSAYCALGEWTKGEAMVDHASHILWQTRNGALWQSLLYFLCRTERFDEAQDLLAQWGALADVPRAASGTVAVLLASTRQWDRVIAFLADRVDQGMEIRNSQVLKAVEQAARQTRRYGEVIAVYERYLAQYDSVAVARYLDRILLEMAFLRELQDGIETVVPGMSSPALTQRLAWWHGLLSANAPAAMAQPDSEVAEVAVDGGIYLCTDRNYLVGTAVAVWSLLRHNRGLKTTWPLTVVCGADGLELAEALFADISQASGVEIRVIGAESLLSGQGQFRTSWGIFTAHPGLTEATYYRMFAAQWLLEQGQHGRAIYLDADTVTGPGMARLFEIDLGGQPLGARTDASLPGVKEAAAKLGLAIETYFNAGVLVLDLDHPSLGDALARTIVYAQEHPEMLTFFDQCALNVGFAGFRAAIPDTFNYFISPVETPLPLPVTASQPAVRHFIGPPKPWDPLYTGDNCLPWLAELAALGDVLAPAILRLLISLPFKGDTRTAPLPAGGSD